MNCELLVADCSRPLVWRRQMLLRTSSGPLKITMWESTLKNIVINKINGLGLNLFYKVFTCCDVRPKKATEGELFSLSGYLVLAWIVMCFTSGSLDEAMFSWSVSCTILSVLVSASPSWSWFPRVSHFVAEMYKRLSFDLSRARCCCYYQAK